jgi:hypothetical protein
MLPGVVLGAWLRLPPLTRTRIAAARHGSPSLRIKKILVGAAYA